MRPSTVPKLAPLSRLRSFLKGRQRDDFRGGAIEISPRLPNERMLSIQCSLTMVLPAPTCPPRPCRLGSAE
ncbi:hypothetical protein RB195_006508 [Necator americanus]|uniref:Uncharacterized protein n=1 Tax=Necator americanus TaxID=51031 RepID=A0ABR1BSY8_NECAM